MKRNSKFIREIENLKGYERGFVILKSGRLQAVDGKGRFIRNRDSGPITSYNADGTPHTTWPSVRDYNMFYGLLHGKH